MRKMIACCGLDCEKCDAYLATINDDRALREKTAKLWSALNQTPILPEQFCESLCGIRRCALKKGVTTCGHCPDMENCQTRGMITANNPEALNNLRGQAVK